MSESVEQCTRALKQAMEESSEYRNYVEAKKKIKEQPQLKSQLETFRSKLYLVHNTETSAITLEEMQELYLEQKEICREPLAEEYLKAELHICRMLQKISMEILNAAEVETEALQDVLSF